jgi:hypothetical protein
MLMKGKSDRYFNDDQGMSTGITTDNEDRELEEECIGYGLMEGNY